jgi:hypothetical protein
MKTLAIAIATLILISPVQAVQILPKSQEDWNCVDYSLDFAKQNPDWGIVTLSNNQYFKGVSHMVNYQFTEENDLKIHDGLYQMNYTLYEWQGAQFYHFWLPNETPCRNYRTLQDNSYLFKKE